MSEPSGYVEEYVVSGRRTFAKIRELLREGNIRRIRLQTKDGQTLVEMPLTLGATSAIPRVMRAPMWAAGGALATVARTAKLKIVVERVR